MQRFLWLGCTVLAMYSERSFADRQILSLWHHPLPPSPHTSTALVGVLAIDHTTLQLNQIPTMSPGPGILNHS